MAAKTVCCKAYAARAATAKETLLVINNECEYAKECGAQKREQTERGGSKSDAKTRGKEAGKDGERDANEAINESS